MTLMINIGKFGGFYCRAGRLCLGWIAFTFWPVDLDDYLMAVVDYMKQAENEAK